MRDNGHGGREDRERSANSHQPLAGCCQIDGTMLTRLSYESFALAFLDYPVLILSSLGDWS